MLLGAGLVLAAPAFVHRARAQGMMDGGMSGETMEGSHTSAAGTLQAGEPFRHLPEIDARGGTLRLRAMSGETRFGSGALTPTMGFEGSYLGPTVRVRRGKTVDAMVTNGTGGPVSTHWHGLNVPSNADGGAPQSVIAPDASWRATLPVAQPAATLWYHTHVHGRTAPDQWAGLAGALIVDDDDSDALGLPSTPGLDDFVLILQDKRFDEDGRAVYQPDMMTIMHGYLGDAVLVNGQFAPAARTPEGPVRLRFINASTSAQHRISFPRPATLIGVDQGLLPRPIEIDEATIAPGERIEVVVDMSDGGSAPISVTASLMGGMMMGMMGNDGVQHTLLTLTADPDAPATGRVPERLTADLEPLSAPVAERSFVLQENMGPMQHVRGMMGRGPTMAINDEPYDPDRISFTARIGTVERWTITAEDMAHPFHAHGVKFLIPDPQRPEETGWKDVVAIDGTRDLLVAIEAPTTGDVPFMFHCHILEHEDAGMMGQFLTA
ncbi:multicopper oxidase family protein [Loktanella sp. 3ANDIMAR09]|uniref:multicopper oxidase family protein n=1 Tax=Loktanella sp. 3ANDIMAR09 TaxID=1225657 RepID=UPI00155E2C22|nr:multicopper oxidase domain-containing protein [Loktanella sp. 3ANDIMAR09]